MKRFMLTVIGKDRAGIIAHVTEQLYRFGCNLEDVSMTVLEGELAMMLIVCIKANRLTQIKQGFEKIAKKSKLTFFWKELPQGLHRGEKHPTGTETFLIRAAGLDRTGIVYKISRVLAQHHLNITDLNCKILNQGKKTLYMLLLEVDIPKKFKHSMLGKKLTALAKQLRIEIQIKPLERIEA